MTAFSTWLSNLPVDVLDGTEKIPLVDSATNKSTTAQSIANLAQAGFGAWTPLGNLGATANITGDSTSPTWTALGSIGASQTLAG